MPWIKKVLLTLALCALSSVASENSEFVLFADSATKKPLQMDFSKPLTGINDPGLVFSQFAGKPLLIYYFSPKCGHCQRHFPSYQALVREFEPRGIRGIAISLGGYIKRNDVRQFIEQFSVALPVFQDGDGQFGPSYGTGYVPVAYLVLPDGTFYRYENMGEKTTEHIRSVLNGLQKKSAE